MAKIHLNTTRWPLVQTKFPPEYSDDEFTIFAQDFVDLAKRNQAYAVVIDLVGAGIPTMKQAEFFKKLIDNERQPLRRHLRGVGIVLESSLMRKVINSILLLLRPPYPNHFVKDKAAAEDYCAARLRETVSAAV